MLKPTRWSYSSLSTYESCPAQWKYSYIDGLEWPSSAAAARGSRLHSLAEGYLMGQQGVIPYELKRIGHILEQMGSAGAKPESVWMLTKDWEPTESKENAWVKSIIDVHYYQPDEKVLYLKDWKSGNSYDDHRVQLELYAIMGMKIYPEAERCDYSAVYIDAGTEGHVGSIIRPMVEPIRVQWHDRAEKMYADETYSPNPGRACKWCPYSWTKGGPCSAGVNY